MEYRHLGRTGVQVSPLGLGSDDFGDGTPPALAEALILRALDAGISLIDTGNLYAGGASEAIIGKTLAEAAGSVFNWPMRTRLSSCGCVTFPLHHNQVAARADLIAHEVLEGFGK